MFVTNLKTEFYDIISGNRILLLVGYDVDSLCACKILQYLFQCDNVLYTLIPVEGKASVLEAFRLHQEQVKYVVMINCGGTIDVIEYLHPEDDVVFFICDTHRPVDVYNVYGEAVRLLMKPEEDEEIPAFADIFRDSEDEDEEETQRLNEAAILKRRERRLWAENREKIMFDYSQFGYYGLASSLIMFDLAWKMSRDSNELLWWAIVGLTEQYIYGKIEQEKYVLNVAELQNHVSRHNHMDMNSLNDSAVSCMKISFSKELNLPLYRQWTLFESLMYSRYMACKFRLWTFKGQRRLHEFLAEIGIPLTQCKQKFTAMDTLFRTNITTWMEDMSEKYKLDQIVYGSFISQFGYKGKFCATDVVYAISAILESVDKEKTSMDKFLSALEALGKAKIPVLKQGIELAKLQCIAVFRQVQSFIDMNHVISAGPFLYAVVQDGTPDTRYFSYPSCLNTLAYFLLEAHVSSSRSRKSRSLPLVLMTLDENSPDHYLVIGIPPLSEGSPKNFFGKAFEQAAEHAKSSSSLKYFDSSIIQINANDKSKFFDALIAILS